MKINDYSFHDSAILKVIEFTEDQTLEYLIDFPVDWEQNVFQPHILSFKNVTKYFVDEILFVGAPTILEVNNEQLDSNTFKTELVTNAGKRIIEYQSLEFEKSKQDA